MLTIISDSIQVVTTMFLIFAAGSFAYQAYRNCSKTSDVMGNIFCALEMIFSIYFMWR